MDMEISVKKSSIKQQIKHSPLQTLVKIINAKYVTYLLLDPRTICRTPTGLSGQIKEICGGEYFHFGLINSFIEFLKSIPELDGSRATYVFLKLNSARTVRSNFGHSLFSLALVMKQVGIFLGVYKTKSVRYYL